MHERLRTRVCTEVVGDDTDAMYLTERVEEVVEDHPNAKVIWLQTMTNLTNRNEVRLTAVITWKEAAKRKEPRSEEIPT